MFAALTQISKHSVSLAEMVIEAEIFPAAMSCLRDPDEYVKKNVVTLMREVVKHTPEVRRALTFAGTNAHKRDAQSSACMRVLFSQLAQVIVNCGGLEAVIDYLGNCHGNVRLPGIMMLGYVAAHSESLAMAVIVSKVVITLYVTANPATEASDVSSCLLCRSC